MSRIELGSVSPKVVQCEHCGRVRVGAEWVRHAGVTVDTVGICGTCMSWRLRVKRAKQAHLDRQVRAKAKQGFGPAPEGVDVFRGFREGES